MKLKKGKTPEDYVNLLLRVVRSESPQVQKAAVDYLVNGGSQKELEERYGVPQSHISRLVGRLNEAHQVVVEGQKYIN